MPTSNGSNERFLHRAANEWASINIIRWHLSKYQNATSFVFSHSDCALEAMAMTEAITKAKTKGLMTQLCFGRRLCFFVSL